MNTIVQMTTHIIINCNKTTVTNPRLIYVLQRVFAALVLRAREKSDGQSVETRRMMKTSTGVLCASIHKLMTTPAYFLAHFSYYLVRLGFVVRQTKQSDKNGSEMRKKVTMYIISTVLKALFRFWCDSRKEGEAQTTTCTAVM